MDQEDYVTPAAITRQSIGKPTTLTENYQSKESLETANADLNAPRITVQRFDELALTAAEKDCPKTQQSKRRGNLGQDIAINLTDLADIGKGIKNRENRNTMSYLKTENAVKSNTGRNVQLDNTVSQIASISNQQKRPKSQSKEMTSMELVRSILRTDPKQRSHNEVKQTQLAFKGNKFLADILKTRDEKTHFELCEKMRLEEYKSGKVVFNFGDPGTYFYVILRGKVDVRVPQQITLEQDSATPEGLISFIILYYKDICWNQIARGDKVLQLFHEELKLLHIPLDDQDNFNTQSTLEIFDKQITYSLTKVHTNIYQLLNPNNYDKIKLMWLKTVNTLSEGDHFGELALTYHKPRAATILCKEESDFATLSRFDYMQVIGKENRRRLKKIVDEFKNYRILSSLRANTIAKIFQYMTKVSYTRGRTIYREGDSPVDFVYFIVDGEFEVTKTIKPDVPKNEQLLQQSDKGTKRMSIDRNQKITEMLRSKAQHPQHHSGKSNTNLFKRPNHLASSQPDLHKMQKSKTIQLYLLGRNEIFGMEEIVEMVNERNFTVTCASTHAACYLMKKDDFQDCVNQFRFGDRVIKELMIKHQIFKERVLQTHIFQQNFAKTLHDKQRQMQHWAKKHEEAAAKSKKSPEVEKVIDLEGRKNNSRLDMSSFLDLSEVMKSEYEELHPKKYDSKAIQVFKKRLLENIVKPLSWGDHRDRIQRSQIKFKERQFELELQIQRNESLGTSLIKTVNNSCGSSPVTRPASSEKLLMKAPQFTDNVNKTDRLRAAVANHSPRLLNSQSNYVKPVKKETKAMVDSQLNQIQQQKTRRQIEKTATILLQDNMLHQIITTKAGDRLKIDRGESIKKIKRSLNKLWTLSQENGEFEQLYLPHGRSERLKSAESSVGSKKQKVDHGTINRTKLGENASRRNTASLGLTQSIVNGGGGGKASDVSLTQQKHQRIMLSDSMMGGNMTNSQSTLHEKNSIVAEQRQRVRLTEPMPNEGKATISMPPINVTPIIRDEKNEQFLLNTQELEQESVQKQVGRANFMICNSQRKSGEVDLVTHSNQRVSQSIQVTSNLGGDSEDYKMQRDRGTLRGKLDSENSAGKNPLDLHERLNPSDIQRQFTEGDIGHDEQILSVLNAEQAYLKIDADQHDGGRCLRASEQSGLAISKQISNHSARVRFIKATSDAKPTAAKSNDKLTQQEEEDGKTQRQPDSKNHTLCMGTKTSSNFMTGFGASTVKATPKFIPGNSCTPKKVIVTQKKPTLPMISIKNSIIQKVPSLEEDINLRNSLPIIPSHTDENLITDSTSRSKIVFMKPNTQVRSAVKTLEGKIEQKIKLRVPLFKADLQNSNSTLSQVEQEVTSTSAAPVTQRKFPTVLDKSPEPIISKVDLPSRDQLLEGKKSHRLIYQNEPLNVQNQDLFAMPKKSTVRSALRQKVQEKAVYARKAARSKNDYVGRNSKESLKSAISTYKLVLPEYLNKPIVRQRQRMRGQLKSLTNNATASSQYLDLHSTMDSHMPMQIQSKVLVEAQSYRQIPIFKSMQVSPTKPPY